MNSMHHSLVSLVCLVSNKHSVVFVSLWLATHWKTCNATAWLLCKFVLVDRLLSVTWSCRCFFKLSTRSLKKFINNTVLRNILSNTKDSVSLGSLNTEKRVENMMGSGLFLTKFEVFG